MSAWHEDGGDGAPRFESYPERLVREAIECGEFDDNPYAGRPVPLGRPGDEKPWIVERLEREDLSGVLPEGLRALRALRRERAAHDDEHPDGHGQEDDPHE